MSDTNPAAPAPEAPAAPAQPAGEQPPAPTPGDSSAPSPSSDPTSQDGGDAYKVHPSWDETFDKAGIPDMLRPTLVEKIRADERAVQQQIEAARGTVPPEWQSLLEEARQQGVSPSELVDGYNTLRTLRDDPLGFQQTLNTQIDAAVAAGNLTRAEGEQAKSEVQDKVDEEFNVSGADPQARELAELRKKIEDREQREQQERQQWEDQQAEEQTRQQESAWADQFFTTIDGALKNDQTYGSAMGDPQQAMNLKVTVGRLAGALLDANPNFTDGQAIEGALTQLRSLGVMPKPPAGQAPPIQGGGSAIPGQPATKMTEAQREAAMLAEAMRMANME